MKTGLGIAKVFVALVDLPFLQEGKQVNAYSGKDGSNLLRGCVEVDIDLAHYKFTEVKGKVIVRMKRSKKMVLSPIKFYIGDTAKMFFNK